MEQLNVLQNDHRLDGVRSLGLRFTQDSSSYLNTPWKWLAFSLRIALLADMSYSLLSGLSIFRTHNSTTKRALGGIRPGKPWSP